MPRVVWSDVELPAHFWADVEPALRQFPNVNPALVVAVAHAENGAFDPTLQSRVLDSKGPNGREDSWGYFQLHRRGVGSGYTLEDLINGRRNSEIALTEMNNRLESTGSLYEAIAPWSVRDSAWKKANSFPYIFVDGKIYGQQESGGGGSEVKSIPTPQPLDPRWYPGDTQPGNDLKKRNMVLLAGFAATVIVTAAVLSGRD